MILSDNQVLCGHMMHLNCAIPLLLINARAPKNKNSFATLPHMCSFLNIREWRESTGGLKMNFVDHLLSKRNLILFSLEIRTLPTPSVFFPFSYCCAETQ